jgi:hypothetical protein
MKGSGILKIRDWFLSGALAATGLLSCPAAQAQDSAQTGSGSCTLHVWPGSPLRSTYSGWIHGGLVDGAVNGRDGYRKLPEKPLDTARQKLVLEGTDIAAALGLSGYAVVVHPEALDSRTLRTTSGPWLADGGACHAELAVDDVFYQEDVFSGRSLKVIYRYRSFRGAATPERTFGQIITEKLTLFPPAKPEDDPKPGFDELAAAMGKSIKDFGTVLTAPPRKKR